MQRNLSTSRFNYPFDRLNQRARGPNSRTSRLLYRDANASDEIGGDTFVPWGIGAKNPKGAFPTPVSPNIGATAAAEGTLCPVNSARAGRVGSFSRTFIQAHKRSSCILMREVSGNWSGIAGGTLIFSVPGKSSLVLTSAHVVHNLHIDDPSFDLTRIAVVFNREYTAATADTKAPALDPNRPWGRLRRVVKAGSTLDIDYALFEVAWVGAPPFGSRFCERIDPYRSCKIGEPVLLYGYPGGGPKQVSASRIHVADSPIYDDFGVARAQPVHGLANFKAAAGASGGGVFSSDGYLVGVYSGGYGRSAPQAYRENFFVQIDAIFQAAQDVLRPKYFLF